MRSTHLFLCVVAVCALSLMGCNGLSHEQVGHTLSDNLKQQQKQVQEIANTLKQQQADVSTLKQQFPIIVNKITLATTQNEQLAQQVIAAADFPLKVTLVTGLTNQHETLAAAGNSAATASKAADNVGASADNAVAQTNTVLDSNKANTGMAEHVEAVDKSKDDKIAQLESSETRDLWVGFFLGMAVLIGGVVLEIESPMKALAWWLIGLGGAAMAVCYFFIKWGWLVKWALLAGVLIGLVYGVLRLTGVLKKLPLPAALTGDLPAKTPDSLILRGLRGMYDDAGYIKRWIAAHQV